MRGFVGYGELGRQIEALVSDLDGPDAVCYFDDIAHDKSIVGAHPFEKYAADEFRDCAFYVCLGYRHLRRKAEIITALLHANRRLPAVRHSSAHLNRSAAVGPGTVVYPLANVDKDVEIGRGVLVNNSVVVSHNARIGDCSYLSPGVVLSGYTTVGTCTFIGSGAVVADGIAIGDDVIVGIGTVVTRDVPSGVSVIGNPMRVLTSKLRI